MQIALKRWQRRLIRRVGFFVITLFLGIINIISIFSIQAYADDMGPQPLTNYHYLDQSAHKIIPVGHRGTVKFAPENTIAAHEAALRMGALALEFDIRMTADGHFVVFHDAMVNRTTNGQGAVNKMTLAELKALDAGLWKGPEFAGERIPTLREALRNIKGRAMVDIDFKAGPENSGAIISDILDEEGFRDAPLVTVFARARHVEKLRLLRAPYALRPHYQDRMTTLHQKRDLGLTVMGLRRRGFSFAKAKTILDNGLVLFSNTMGFSDNKQGYDDSVRAGARFIQTDHLDRLVPYLNERALLADCLLDSDYECWGAPSTGEQIASAQ